MFSGEIALDIGHCCHDYIQPVNCVRLWNTLLVTFASSKTLMLGFLSCYMVLNILSTCTGMATVMVMEQRFTAITRTGAF